jgi:steroid delta-isomerase
MPTAEQMRDTMQQYLERVAQGDVDGVLALFSDDVSVEDPVGGAPGTHLVGREAVGAFFRKGFARSRPAPRLQGPIRTTAGNEAAMSFVLGLALGDDLLEFDVIDVMRFDEEGKVATLRAFWNPAEGRKVLSEPGSQTT